MTTPLPEYWTIDGIDFKPRRWWITPEDRPWYHGAQWRTAEGQPLDLDEWPAPAPQFIYEKLPQVEDLLNASMFIVSPRLREFLETEAPGHCEFFPAHIRGSKPDDPRFDYWAINWLHAIDCLHPQSYDGTFTMDGRPNVMVPIVDVSRINFDLLIGPIKDFRVQVILREDVKRKMKAAKFINPWFQRIAHADGRNFKPFIRPD